MGNTILTDRLYFSRNNANESVWPSADEKEVESKEQKHLENQQRKEVRNPQKVVTPMLTDLYQLTMVYSYFMWKKHTHPAVFDLFFRICPFNGQYTVFCGLEDCRQFLNNFKYTEDDLEYLKEVFEDDEFDQGYFEYLRTLDCSEVKIYAQSEGAVCFPRIPLLRIEGPLGICQLLETSLLNLVNFSSLIATNAARHRQVVGPDVSLLEFGLRRAQGPDGGMRASRFSYVGGYNGTSNVACGKMFDIPVKGTHAHSYVSSFLSFKELHTHGLSYADELKPGKMDFVKTVRHWREKLMASNTHEGELVAFTAYALNYPGGFIALIDTYDSLNSGLLNYAVVAMSLIDAGYRPIGIRIDSGDIVAQSIAIKKYFKKIGEAYDREEITNSAIFASDGISEDKLYEYKARGKVTAYGVGTHLVTCKKQPALGGVYKLVELNGLPRIKLSEDPIKITIPGKKNAFRVFNEQKEPICDVLTAAGERSPASGEEHLFRHVAGEKIGEVERVTGRVENLLHHCWHGSLCNDKPPMELKALRTFCMESVNQLPLKHRRKVNPAAYPVLVTEELYNTMESMKAEAYG